MSRKSPNKLPTLQRSYTYLQKWVSKSLLFLAWLHYKLVWTHGPSWNIIHLKTLDFSDSFWLIIQYTYMYMALDIDIFKTKSIYTFGLLCRLKASCDKRPRLHAAWVHYRPWPRPHGSSSCSKRLHNKQLFPYLKAPFQYVKSMPLTDQ